MREIKSVQSLLRDLRIKKKTFSRNGKQGVNQTRVFGQLRLAGKR